MPSNPSPEEREVPSENYSWHDAGYKRQVIADASGKIVGSVDESQHSTMAYGPAGFVGQYVTRELAKDAVLRSLAGVPNE